MTRPRSSKGRAGEAVVLAGRYRLEAQVATGGMGEVWRATDLVLERTVAVKLLRESLAEDPVVAERFRREALTAAGLSHPNMADVYDYVQEDGRPGIVMEYVEGETLADRIARDGALDVADTVRIVSAVLAVLEVAHKAGIVHRDVKPGNVMLSPAGEVKVTDFGIARAAGHETLTETGMVVGTAHYLSPEQVNGKTATPSSDQYAVGAILYEMLTGTKPFEAETPLAVAMKRLNEDPTPPRQHRPDLPERVVQVALRALARDPAQRFGSADGMRLALEAALASIRPPRVDPTPTMMLPTVENQDAETMAVRAAPETTTPVTGSSPAEAVARRRRRDYRRGLVWLLVVAVLAGLLGLGAWGLIALGRSEPATMPNFEGMQIARAKAIASDLGLVAVEVRRASERPEGEIISQDIAPDVRVAKGERVTLVVSTGTPPCCTVPNVLNLSEEDAKAAIRDAGFEVGQVTELTVEGVEAGTVIGQDPDGGETKPSGTEVDIVVAKEPRRGKGKGNGD